MRGWHRKRRILLLVLMAGAAVLMSLAFTSDIWWRITPPTSGRAARLQEQTVTNISLVPTPLLSLRTPEHPKEALIQQQENSGKRGQETPGDSAVGVPTVHDLPIYSNQRGKSNMTVQDMESFPASAAELFSSHNMSGEPGALLQDLYQRAKRVNKACASLQHAGTVTGIFTHDPSRIAYCFLPKVGCTFWIRVFSFLHNFTGEVVRSPWEISRLKVHNTPHSHGVDWPSVRNKTRDYVRFMFVRHPFSRLWSAYVDKLFLPDFWKDIGMAAVRKLRGQYATKEASRCGHDLTFSEFVEFSLTTYEPHWEPIYQRCDPCQFRPAVVGEMRSFTSDSLFLLRRMGLEWVLKDMDQRTQAENELITLVRYNFELTAGRPFYKPCLNSTSLAHRLWKTFQINGYIPDSEHFPMPPQGGEVSAKWFEGRVIEAFRTALPRKQLLKDQKRTHLHQALASLSPELMRRVRTKYSPDMTYFGFDDSNY